MFLSGVFLFFFLLSEFSSKLVTVCVHRNLHVNTKDVLVGCRAIASMGILDFCKFLSFLDQKCKHSITFSRYYLSGLIGED